MANASFNQIMSAPQITRVISTIQTPQSRLQNFFGMNPGGWAENPVGGHFAGWDIFDKTRKMAQGRAPGTGPGTSAPQIVGHVSTTLYRSHEKMHLSEDRIFRIRPLGQNWGTIDLAGQKYITKQEEYMAQKFKNSREYLVYSMMRGKLGLKQDGDNWLPCAPGAGSFDVDFQVPDGNKTQLEMISGSGNIIGTSWATTATADIVGDMLQVNAANEQLHGRIVTHIWTDSVVLNYMLNNTGLKGLGGTANTVFNQFSRTNFTGPDGQPDTGYEVVFKGMPWLTVHSYDAGLEVDGTYTKFFNGTQAYFCPDPDMSWCEFMVGSERVVENPMTAAQERFGLYAWIERTTQPAGWELITVDNGLPALYIPKAAQFPTVVF